MNIVVFWEQYSWGGTDTHLLSWAQGQSRVFKDEDQLIILSNNTNPGFTRIEKELNAINCVKARSFSLWSYYAVREAVLAQFKNSLLKKIVSKLLVIYFPISLIVQLVQLYYHLSRCGKVDVAVSNNGAYPGAWGNLLFILAAKISFIKKNIMLVHHHATREMGAKRIISGVIDFLGLYLPSHIVAVSKATKDTIVESREFNNPDKIRIVFNGLDFENAKVDTSGDLKEYFYSHFNISRECKLVGILGVQEEYKGHDDFIKAMGILKKKQKLKNIFLLIVGKEDLIEKKRLSAIIEENHLEKNVAFTGYLKQSSYDIVQSLDLLVVATKDFEGFGLTLGEAMTVGTPVLSTNVGAIPEFVFHGENGYLVRPENPLEMSLALENFIENPDQWVDRAKKAKETIKKFSLENMARNFHQLFKESK